MGALDDAKTVLNKTTNPIKKIMKKTSKINKHSWFSIGGYTLQTTAVVVPMAITITADNAWTKVGLGFGVIMSLFILLIIFWSQIKKLNKIAPGIIPMIFIFLFAGLMYLSMKTVLIVSGCGIAGAIAASPLHVAYLNSKDKTVTPETLAMLEIAERLKQIGDKEHTNT